MIYRDIDLGTKENNKSFIHIERQQVVFGPYF